MKDLQRSGLTREQWSAMTLYEKFEQIVIFVLSVIIAAIVVASVWALMREVVNRLVLGAFDTLDYATFQVVFGMIFTVVIALEFKRSILVATERSFGILQVRTIVLIALLAIARKFIILDLGETESSKIAALAGAALALGVVHWLVRDQDRREQLCCDPRHLLQPEVESGPTRGPDDEAIEVQRGTDHRHPA
jgi:uncharacterized membrane protein (DUF373 family)